MLRFLFSICLELPLDPIPNGIIDRRHKIGHDSTIDNRCQDIHELPDAIPHRAHVHDDRSNHADGGENEKRGDAPFDLLFPVSFMLHRLLSFLYGVRSPYVFLTTVSFCEFIVMSPAPILQAIKKPSEKHSASGDSSTEVTPGRRTVRLTPSHC